MDLSQGHIWIYVISRVRPSVFRGNIFTLNIKRNFLKSFYTCHAYRHHGLLQFYLTFSDLDLGWGLQGQHKAKPVDLIFSHTV